MADDFLMNVGNDGNSFEIVDDDQFPFTINDDDALPEPYIDDDSNDNAATGEGEHENDGDCDDEDENEADAGEDNHMNNDSTSTLLGGESNASENASESDRLSENEQENTEGYCFTHYCPSLSSSHFLMYTLVCGLRCTFGEKKWYLVRCSSPRKGSQSTRAARSNL